MITLSYQAVKKLWEADFVITSDFLLRDRSTGKLYVLWDAYRLALRTCYNASDLRRTILEYCKSINPSQ
ncbi:MAG: hypothetical protein RMM53_04275 [Bacteroidia bacterium]|nr:hypothetical protein [Bacteroidia bacterium]MDW8333414.1 hypothetical protein [Bacteroidia bacterium]